MTGAYGICCSHTNHAGVKLLTFSFAESDRGIRNPRIHGGFRGLLHNISNENLSTYSVVVTEFNFKAMDHFLGKAFASLFQLDQIQNWVDRQNQQKVAA